MRARAMYWYTHYCQYYYYYLSIVYPYIYSIYLFICALRASFILGLVSLRVNRGHTHSFKRSQRLTLLAEGRLVVRTIFL